MARRRKRRTLKPRVPSRVRRKKRGAKKAEGHQHPELIGLGLVALGVFLVAVVWAGWNGGYVGLWVGNGLDALIGGAALALPAALVIVGGLISDLALSIFLLPTLYAWIARDGDVLPAPEETVEA